MSGVGVERVYDGGAGTGTRVLVDRLWPRGLSKEKAAVDEWLKELAPTTDLRRWYAHDPEKYDDFRERYLDELDDEAHAPALARLRELAGQGPMTMLTATKDLQLSHTRILLELL